MGGPVIKKMGAEVLFPHVFGDPISSIKFAGAAAYGQVLSLTHAAGVKVLTPTKDVEDDFFFKTGRWGLCLSEAVVAGDPGLAVTGQGQMLKVPTGFLEGVVDEDTILGIDPTTGKLAAILPTDPFACGRVITHSDTFDVIELYMPQPGAAPFERTRTLVVPMSGTANATKGNVLYGVGVAKARLLSLTFMAATWPSSAAGAITAQLKKLGGASIGSALNLETGAGITPYTLGGEVNLVSGDILVVDVISNHADADFGIGLTAQAVFTA